MHRLTRHFPLSILPLLILSGSGCESTVLPAWEESQCAIRMTVSGDASMKLDDFTDCTADGPRSPMFTTIDLRGDLKIVELEVDVTAGKRDDAAAATITVRHNDGRVWQSASGTCSARITENRALPAEGDGIHQMAGSIACSASLPGPTASQIVVSKLDFRSLAHFP